MATATLWGPPANRLPPTKMLQATQNTKCRWAVALGPTWHWDRINAWLDGGTARAEWEFKQPGETTLRIGGREDATMLDALFITTNVKTKDHGAANIRFPTKKDREIQVKG